MIWIILLIGLGSYGMLLKSKIMRKKWQRFNAYLNLSDLQYSRLQMILKSDCDIPGIISHVSGMGKPASDMGQSHVSKSSADTHTSKQIATRWYEENHERLEETVYKLSADGEYLCEINRYTRLPEYSHWRQLASKLLEEWNVACYWNEKSFYISWKQK